MLSMQRWPSLLLLVSVTSAHQPISQYFAGTSPFYLFSSSTLSLSSLTSLQLAVGDDIESAVRQSLVSCPSDTYVVVSQPGVEAFDYDRPNAASNLQRRLAEADARTASSLAIPQVQGSVDTRSLVATLQKQCDANVVSVNIDSDVSVTYEGPQRVIVVDLPALSVDNREAALYTHDTFLERLLSTVTKDKPYTVIYTTTASSKQVVPQPLHAIDPYEMDDMDLLPVHMEMKRDLSDRAVVAVSGARLPLFEKYQFLSPGIFMGLFVFIFLFLLLYVGLSALSSIQVSYFAFSKEMGPAAQKKQ